MGSNRGRSWFIFSLFFIFQWHIPIRLEAQGQNNTFDPSQPHDPVLLIHGLHIPDIPLRFDDDYESTWDSLSADLVNEGWDDGGVIGVGLPDTNRSADFYKIRLSSGDNLTFKKQGQEVQEAIEKIIRITQKPKVVLVGFSMGGLSARAYLQDQGNSAKASALITIMTPHSGSYLAFFSDESEIKSWFLELIDPLQVSPVVEGVLDFIESPASNYLRPCHPLLTELNSQIHRMPLHIPYVNVVSQLPWDDKRTAVYTFFSWYRDAYEKCQGAIGSESGEIGSESLLIKGDGIVPVVSQTLLYTVLNTRNIQNLNWERNANISYKSGLEIFHYKATKKIEFIEAVKQALQEVLTKISPVDNASYSLVVELSPNPIQFDDVSETAVTALLLNGSNPVPNETITFS